MKKRILPNNKPVNYDLKIDQIKKNSDVDLEYHIKRIKKERKYTAILVMFFVAIILVTSVVVFSKIDTGNKSISQVVSGNLTTTFEIDENGVRNSISMRKAQTTYYYHFTVKNNSRNKQKYIVYLEPDEAMIKLDGCANNLAFYDTIMYKINNGEEFELSSTHENDKYIIYKSEVKPYALEKIKLEMYYSNIVKNDKHYHGLIKIKNINS
jgi:hypothetical protein